MAHSERTQRISRYQSEITQDQSEILTSKKREPYLLNCGEGVEVTWAMPESKRSFSIMTNSNMSVFNTYKICNWVLKSEITHPPLGVFSSSKNPSILESLGVP